MVKNIALIGLNPLSGNKGVGALAYSTIYLLDEISKSKKIEFQYYIIGNFVTREDSLLIAEKEIRIKYIRLNISNGLIGFTLSLLRILKVFKYIRKIDCVMDMGEGDSFSDIYGKNRFNAINNPKILFRILKKKQLLLPQTIGPFNDFKIEKKAIKSINMMEVVFARDRQSLNYVLAHTKQKQVHEFIDVAFFMPYEKMNFAQDKIHVGINVSSLLWHGGYTKKNQFNLTVDYQSLINEIIKYFLSLTNVTVHLVPHVVLENPNLENDYEVSYNLIQEYNNDIRLKLAPFFLTPIMAKNYIAGLNFFVGARMHSTIAAFSSGVPVFPMAYSRKFNGLFEDTLEYKYMGDMKSQNNKEVVSYLKYAFENRNELKNIINERIEGIISERVILFKSIIFDFIGD